MKLNNKGFALTSVIYMLIVLFLMTMLLILANLAQRKVVLDKIKSDVKQELNQGGVLAQNIYTVTFDPTIGQINQTSKQVKYNEPYGELPTPTREGYKFIGWTSKNLAPEINETNYEIYHHGSNTNSEFNNENGTNYIRINGYQQNENIDTMWLIHTKNKLKFLMEGTYVLSFDIRSENSIVTQSIMKVVLGAGNTQGRTGIYARRWTSPTTETLLSNIGQKYDFDNDGEWHHFTSLITIPYSTHDAFIAIGNDQPNLYGENSYIDIKNIQLERGETATSYEPYQEYTSDTVVTKQENHTLYAMWEYDYTQYYDNVEYVKSNGNQYINLNYAAKKNTEVRLDIELIENSNTELTSVSGNNNIIGREAITEDNAYSINIAATGTNSKNHIYYWLDKTYASGATAYFKAYSSVTPRSTMIVKSGSATFQGETITVATKTADNTNKMILLGSFNSDQNKIFVFNRYDVKIYGFQIYEGTELVKNLVPVKQKSDNKPGLYDTINNIFYPSNGEQDFLIN